MTNKRNTGPHILDAHSIQPAFASLHFTYEHRDNKERHTVSVTRAEVIEHMDEQLFVKLTDKFCECEAIGETNVVECRCNEYTEEFGLVPEVLQRQAAAHRMTYPNGKKSQWLDGAVPSIAKHMMEQGLVLSFEQAYAEGSTTASDTAGQIGGLQARLALVEAENAARARQAEIINDRYASALNTSETIGKELDQAKVRGDELESIVRLAREFVKNGIELGYITMPEDDTPDPAHDLLPRMDAVLGNDQT